MRGGRARDELPHQPAEAVRGLREEALEAEVRTESPGRPGPRHASVRPARRRLLAHTVRLRRAIHVEFSKCLEADTHAVAVQAAAVHEVRHARGGIRGEIRMTNLDQLDARVRFSDDTSETFYRLDGELMMFDGAVSYLRDCGFTPTEITDFLRSLRLEEV